METHLNPQRPVGADACLTLSRYTHSHMMYFSYSHMYAYMHNEIYITQANTCWQARTPPLKKLYLLVYHQKDPKIARTTFSLQTFFVCMCMRAHTRTQTHTNKMHKNNVWKTEATFPSRTHIEKMNVHSKIHFLCLACADDKYLWLAIITEFYYVNVFVSFSIFGLW